MKNVKFVFALFLAVAVFVTLCACGDDSHEQGQPFSSGTNGITDKPELPEGTQKPSVGEAAVISSPEPGNAVEPFTPDNGSTPDTSEVGGTGIVLPNVGI